jgi:hypothetical protein
LLDPWGVAVHGEENMMVYLVKQVRMLASTPAPMGVVVLIGGDGGGVSGSIDSGGNLRFKGGHH